MYGQGFLLLLLSSASFLSVVLAVDNIDFTCAVVDLVVLSERNYLAITRFSNLFPSPITQAEVCFPAQCDTISKRCVTKWGTILACDGSVGTMLSNETSYACTFGAPGAIPPLNLTSATASAILNQTVTVPNPLAGCNSTALNATSCASTDRTQTCAWVNLMPPCATDSCCDRFLCDGDCAASNVRMTRNFIAATCDNTPRNLGQTDAYICNCDGPVDGQGALVVSSLINNAAAVTRKGCPNNASQTLRTWQERLGAVVIPNATVDLSPVLLGGGATEQMERRWY